MLKSRRVRCCGKTIHLQTLVIGISYIKLCDENYRRTMEGSATQDFKRISRTSNNGLWPRRFVQFDAVKGRYHGCGGVGFICGHGDGWTGIFESRSRISDFGGIGSSSHSRLIPISARLGTRPVANRSRRCDVVRRKIIDSVDIVFADPPFDLPQLAQLPETVLSGTLLVPGGWFIWSTESERMYPQLVIISKHESMATCIFSLFQTPTPPSP